MSRSISYEKTTLFNSSQCQRLVDMQFISSNRHDVSIKWLDTKMDPNDKRTQLLLNQLNDRVELFNNIRDCLNYLYECRETVLLIVSGKCAVECLRSIHSLPSIDSIIIFCASPKKYHYLMNDTYSKILHCIANETELIQCVHKWIDLKCQLHFYIWNNQTDTSKLLTREIALFLANYLLSNCIESHTYDRRKQEMLKICQAYYGQNPSELEHIREFELTYTSTDAINWYTRNSFVHKIVNRALRSFDNTKLHAIAFYIRDLRLQLRELCSTTNSKDIVTVYHGLIMTQIDINKIQSIPTGSLLSTNGFLSTSQKREIAIDFATKKLNTLDKPLCNVLLEINLNIDNSPIIYADIGHMSAFPEEGEILFDIGTILCLQNVIYDEETQLYIIKLTIATQDNYNSIEELLKIVRYQLEEHIDNDGQISLIGKLLNINQQFKKHDDHWQTFSLLRLTFNNLWQTNHDKYKYFFDEHMPWLTKFYHFLQLHHYPKIDKLNKYNELSLARFEPVLFFCLNDKLIQDQRENFSTMFKLQYRRFISKHLTLIEIEENLEEYYYIYYISSELPLYMKENRRIKFYELKLSSTDNQDPFVKIKLIERLISQLLHDLGMFYSDQLKSLSNEQENKIIAKELMTKGAKCYQLLANESEKISQRYKVLLSNSTQPPDEFQEAPLTLVYDPGKHINNPDKQLKPFGSIVKICCEPKDLINQIKNATKKQLYLLLIFSNNNDVEMRHFLTNYIPDQTHIHSLYLIFPNGTRFHDKWINTDSMSKLGWCRSYTTRLFRDIRDVCEIACNANLAYYRQRMAIAQDAVDLNTIDGTKSLVKLFANEVQKFSLLLSTYLLTYTSLND